MLLFIPLNLFRSPELVNFKTSYVIVYRCRSHSSMGTSRISKHLMLLFILDKFIFFAALTHISKHLMLLFIKDEQGNTKYITVFQNISCYCLSGYIPVLHSGKIAFQNISCYCLSAVEIKVIQGTPRFQNISCYCLSERSYQQCSQELDISKHLMLLFIKHPFQPLQLMGKFQNISCYCLSNL